MKFTVNFKSFFLARNNIVSFITHECHGRINFFTSTTALDSISEKTNAIFYLGMIQVLHYMFFAICTSKRWKNANIYISQVINKLLKAGIDRQSQKPTEDSQF